LCVETSLRRRRGRPLRGLTLFVHTRERRCPSNSCAIRANISSPFAHRTPVPFDAAPRGTGVSISDDLPRHFDASRPPPEAATAATCGGNHAEPLQPGAHSSPLSQGPRGTAPYRSRAVSPVRLDAVGATGCVWVGSSASIAWSYSCHRLLGQCTNALGSGACGDA
jgi:hypothetical protein